MRKITVAGVLAVGAIALAAGSASTASNTVPSSVAGYGTSTVSGATAESLEYTLSADGTTITDAALVFTGNLTGQTVEAGFGSNALTACSVGTYDSVNNETPVTCAGFSQATSTSSTFNVAVV
ncbi:hypothetical protein [Blastococcus mobilis]|uniref:Neocarzinostatin family protein n=1 Tax=Blastococcus mobilis TaxID=1938746 RepID=A0A238Y1G3_9ACTN|nr:hypothetical protein [Blastococcus mobilis]SNR64820.1 hypothetical protein SAMN06272737_11721 [Blastococcus mobilis]